MTLDDELVRKVRKIAVGRDTTLTGMVREYLQNVAEEDSRIEAERRREALKRLEESFEKYQLKLEKITWRREELYERGKR